MSGTWKVRHLSSPGAQAPAGVPPRWHQTGEDCDGTDWSLDPSLGEGQPAAPCVLEWENRISRRASASQVNAAKICARRQQSIDGPGRGRRRPPRHSSSPAAAEIAPAVFDRHVKPAEGEDEASRREPRPRAWVEATPPRARRRGPRIARSASQGTIPVQSRAPKA